MTRYSLLTAALCGILLMSAGIISAGPRNLAAQLWGGPEAVEASEHNRNFRAHLTGAEEVADPPVETRAQGQAIFQLSKDGSELSYKLIVANIENVLMAHIHLAPAGVNGPVVVWLYPADGPPGQLIPGRSDGVLAQGVITADDLVGPLAGADLADLLDAMGESNAYVNVHTEQFPSGEIRGQIR